MFKHEKQLFHPVAVERPNPQYAARICRVDHQLGSLRVGKDADLVLYEGNPLEIASSIRATVINGEVVWPGKMQKNSRPSADF